MVRMHNKSLLLKVLMLHTTAPLDTTSQLSNFATREAHDVTHNTCTRSHKHKSGIE